jgi:hypothetical protein
MVIEMEELIKTIEADLRQVVETELMKFRDRYPECKLVDSIYFNEHISIGVYDVLIHGLTCNHYLNVFVGGSTLYELPEFSCHVEFIDKEHDYKASLGRIVLVYLPGDNRCYIKTEIHEYELHDTAVFIVRAAAEEERRDLEAEQG